MAAAALLLCGCDGTLSGTKPLPECGIENCHGLDIACGPDVPDFCTEEYRLGDFCRKFVSCEIIGGSCERVESPAFLDCRSCVEECARLLSPIEAFDCESRCRGPFE